MSKQHHTRWRLFLLLCAAGIAFAGGAASPVAGDDPHTVYLPVIENNPLIYLPVIFDNRLPYPYSLQPGSPTYLSNFLNNAGCNWFGMAGRAFGLDGNPVIGLTVHLEGGGINVDVVTGSGPAALGPGSYEIPLGDHPVETTNVYFVQLRTSMGGALSDVFMIPTHAQCSMNLVLVNFSATHSLSADTATPPLSTPKYPSPTPAPLASPTPTRAP
jgi:hypothetical protein